MDLALFFDRLCAMLQLGEKLSEPSRVGGGFLHTMYKLVTSHGTYVVKLLNPNIMTRPTALENYAEAERLEAILESHSIQIIPAMTFNGKKMQELEGQYCYVFYWYGGKPIYGNQITKAHCEIISKALAAIHSINTNTEKFVCNKININWDKCLARACENSCDIIVELLQDNIALLCESQEKGNVAIESLPKIRTICHNDMDSKNVLWENYDYRIVDLECLGYSNPYVEMLESALCWSGYEECNIDFERLNAFVSSYLQFKPSPNIDWEVLYYSNFGRLEWLEYNVRRALWQENATVEEQQLALAQVKTTMKHIVYYHKIKTELLACLRNCK